MVVRRFMIALFQSCTSQRRNCKFPKVFLDFACPDVSSTSSWSPNFDLLDIDLDNLAAPEGKANKSLTHAYQLAAEKHDLQHWKDVLIEFQLAREAEAEAKAAKAAEKLAAKSAGKGKRKSKSAADADENANDDVEMADAPPADDEEVAEKKPKSSKKRKATTDAEESVEVSLNFSILCTLTKWSRLRHDPTPSRNSSSRSIHPPQKHPMAMLHQSPQLKRINLLQSRLNLSPRRLQMARLKLSLALLNLS